MQIFYHPSQFPAKQPVCLAIGMFDGVHRGHQQVIGQAISEARSRNGLSVVVTFDKHPATVVAPDRAPQLIYSLSQKLRAIAATGADAAWVIPFDAAFSQLTGSQFVRGIVAEWSALKAVSVGETFAFGCRRSGDVTLLRVLGRELGFEVFTARVLSNDGDVISSTRIREAIRGGNLADASQMLGRDYSLCGPVVQGDHIGRQIGFRTANIDTGSLVRPPNGVYAIHAEFEGKHCSGVLNIGCRPTLRQPEPRLQVEAHLLDFDQEIYGRELEVILAGKLRDERRFASVDELRSQIGTDIARMRQLFGI